MNHPAKKSPSGPNHWILALASVAFLFFGVSEITRRALLEVEGTIAFSATTTEARPISYYRLQASDGRVIEFISSPTGHSLPSGLPVGTKIKKTPYHLSWQRNGETVDDFPLAFYLVICGAGLGFAYWSWFQWKSNRRKPGARDT